VVVSVRNRSLVASPWAKVYHAVVVKMHSCFVRWEAPTESRENIGSLWTCLPSVKNCASLQLSRNISLHMEGYDLLIESKKDSTS
jgi:hypothetical protein